ncbi:hypothetical protein BCV70DRAFT_80897 [Testicularia cyperi]|uniref:Uncharacterized protein n=1 Tax=Testicularia cyperi TaxID=1882483 RepID=A0A317XFI5_9BASI|nr:hypothetical protein BCV70DRAFT_80897 [Testicularia cyperi]
MLLGPSATAVGLARTCPSSEQHCGLVTHALATTVLYWTLCNCGGCMLARVRVLVPSRLPSSTLALVPSLPARSWNGLALGVGDCAGSF